jgi:pilus assembly protein CpaC
MKRTGFGRWAFVLLIAIAGMGAVVWAQAPLPTAALVAAPAPSDVEPGSVRLLVGRSTVLDIGTAIARVSLTSSDVADALVTSPNQILVNGKLPGTISMFVWDRGGSLRRYEVVVQRDLARLSEQMRDLFPGEHIEVQSNGKNVVLSGLVTSKDVIEKAINVAAGYVDKKDEVVALLQLQEGAPSNQVLLHVRFAEVDRTALSQLGANFTTGAGGVQGKGTIFQTTTGQYPVPSYDPFDKGAAAPGDGPLKQTFSDLLNLFLFNNKSNIGAIISAMQQRGLFQSLAEPNLVAESGKEASFLAGGEFPVPIAQGNGNNLAITVQYKEFGVRLSFTPVVTGNRVHLKVRPEVSTLDFANAIVLNGFRIPALSTRRTETELELENNQTFAVAGLMNNSVNSTMQKIPGIGDIPILGQLFRSKAAQKNQTELVVMITPEILPNNSSGAARQLPRTPEQYMPPVPEKGSYAVPPARPRADVRPVSAQPRADVAPVAAPRAANVSPAAQGAAAIAALTPSGTRLVDTVPVPAAAVEPAAAPARTASAPAEQAPAPAPVSAPTALAATPVIATTAVLPVTNTTEAPARPLTSREKKAIAQAHKVESQKAADLAKAQAKADAKAKEDEKNRLKKQTELDAKAQAAAKKQNAKS